MKKRKLATFLFAPFFLGTANRRAIGSSVGFLIGLLPLGYGIWVMAVLMSFVFQLNIVAVLVGMALSLIVPMLEFVLYQVDPKWGAFLHENIPLQMTAGVLGACLLYVLLRKFFDDKSKINDYERKFVFDDNGIRWHFFKRAILLLTIMAIGTLSIFGVSLWTKPDMVPYISLPKLVSRAPVAFNQVASHINKITPSIKKVPSKNESPKHLSIYNTYTPWDGNAWIQLNDKKQIKKVDVLMPEYYSLSSLTRIDIDREEKVDQLAKANRVKIIPIWQIVQGNDNLLPSLLKSTVQQNILIEQLIRDQKQQGYAGIHLKFPQVTKLDKHYFQSFINHVTDSFHQAGLQVLVTLPLDTAAVDVKSLAQKVDACMVSLQSKNIEKWIHRKPKQFDIPANKFVFSIDVNGYDQIIGTPRSTMAVSFLEAMRRATESHLPVQWDKKLGTPYMAYREAGKVHLLTFPDATTVWNQLQMVQATSASGVTLGPMGQADERIWDMLKSPSGSKPSLEQVAFSSPLYRGEGGVIHTVQQAKAGYRKIAFDSQGWISRVDYTNVPSPMVIQKYGAPNNKQISLTFDDGPDGKYTPEILDILARYDVRASFYIVGEQVIKYPWLLKRLVAEGHDVGNHTYSHPALHLVSDAKAAFDLNLNQRLVQAWTGHTMNTFRAPYLADSEPYAALDLKPVGRGETAGYTMIGEQIDPTDWAAEIKADQIVQGVLKQLDYGNIILLHDAGGDRKETIKALPTIIETLQKRGYEFATISQLMGKSHTDGLPKESVRDEILRPFGLVVFTFLSMWQIGLTYLMYIVIILGIFRVISFLFLSNRQHRKSHPSKQKYRTNYQPKVSVVIAAYNEEKVINQTIASILDSVYPSVEVLVINDGSTDKTEAVVKEAFSSASSVQLITKENGGKTAAVNVGFQQASGEIVVSIDADTLIHKEAITYLVRHFYDPKVVAVSGNIKVGNVNNLLTLWQHVEYVTGFNLERRAFDQLNCIPVVPGAIGAWRKDLVAEAGYFKEDTLAEDTDLTIQLLRQGYQINYENRAVAYTEAPEDVGGFVKQRTRWIYGTLQSLWKHRGALFSRDQKGLGFVSLPNMWIFQYGVQLLSPFIDVLFFFSLFTPYARSSIVFYFVFLVFDYFTAFHSFGLEKERKRPLVWLFVQRFVYRQLMTYIVALSLFYALKGVAVGWNKLKRTGNIRMEDTTDIEEQVPVAIEAS